MVHKKIIKRGNKCMTKTGLIFKVEKKYSSIFGVDTAISTGITKNGLKTTGGKMVYEFKINKKMFEFYSSYCIKSRGADDFVPVQSYVYENYWTTNYDGKEMHTRMNAYRVKQKHNPQNIAVENTIHYAGGYVYDSRILCLVNDFIEKEKALSLFLALPFLTNPVDKKHNIIDTSIVNTAYTRITDITYCGFSSHFYSNGFLRGYGNLTDERYTMYRFSGIRNVSEMLYAILQEDAKRIYFGTAERVHSRNEDAYCQRGKLYLRINDVSIQLYK